MRVLVTGASGLIGSALAKRLVADGHEVLAAARVDVSHDLPATVPIRMNPLGSGLLPLVEGHSADVVVHAAARVHVMREAGNPSPLFRAVNVAGSISLARQVRELGARRFIYLSSVKALGEHSEPGRPLTADSVPTPSDEYGRSKLEAERELSAFCSEHGMELVIVRPPLVYGPGVGANFGRLMRAVRDRRPLPFGLLTRNRRSFVALDNLVDLVSACVTTSSVPRKPLLVSDGEDLSTAALVIRLARAMNVAPRLLPVPIWLLQAAGAAAGRREAVQRLCDSLQVDIGLACQSLGWAPRISVDEGLLRAVLPLMTGERA